MLQRGIQRHACKELIETHIHTYTYAYTSHTHMVLAINMGTRLQIHNIVILVIGTPKMVPPEFGKP